MTTIIAITSSSINSERNCPPIQHGKYIHAVYYNYSYIHIQLHAVYIYNIMWQCMHASVLMHRCTMCVHNYKVILFFLQTMKIVLVVVALVACFAAVNCQDALCFANGLINNPSLATCNSANVSLIYTEIFKQQICQAWSSTNSSMHEQFTLLQHDGDFCQLSCINDFAALHNSCGYSTNPITASKLVL